MTTDLFFGSDQILVPKIYSLVLAIKITRSKMITIRGQISALLHRNFILQFRQIKTNVAQLVFPILLMIVLITMNNALKKAMEQNGNNGDNQQYNVYKSTYNFDQSTGTYYWFKNPPAGWDAAGINNISQPNTTLLGNLKGGIYTLYNSTGYINIPVPVFKEITNGSIDEAMYDYFYNTVLPDFPKYAYNFDNFSYIIPSYGITFNELSLSQKILNYSIENFYTAMNNGPYSYNFVRSYWDSSDGDFISMLNNAFIKMTLGQNYYINGDLTYFDVYVNFNIDTLSYMMGLFFLPIVFTFIFPVFVFNLVQEKEKKLFQVMSMMGLKNITYILSNYLFFIILYLIIATVMIIMGCAGSLPYFLKEPFRIILLIVVYGFSLVSLAFLFSAFFWKSKTSAIISYIFVLVAPSIGSNLDMFVFRLKPVALPYLWVPQFAFSHGLYVVFIALSTSDGSYDYMMSLSNYSEYGKVVVTLVMEAIVFFLLGVYFNNVIPKEFGVTLSPFYPIQELIKLFKKKDEHGETTKLLEETSLLVNDTDDIIEEDQDCANERTKANSNQKFLLKAINIKKTYKTKGVVKEALVNFCLTSGEGEILGLLGPNGAGKTTFIHIIGGMYKPTSGDAFINGLSIRNEMHDIYNFLGFCPQHDILYDDLTIQQHLEFYSKLKGLYDSHEQILQHIDYVLAKVKLEEHRFKRITELSGGMKRRVSISIALLGNNKLILLDEPSTGLDPDARRSVWDIIQDIRHDKTILITTHNMEEADVLSNKIAIIASGRLQCVGSPIYLKNRYGNGFKLQIVPLNEGFRSSLIKFVLDNYPMAMQQESVSDELIFLIPKDSDISTIFDIISKNKHELGIKEWGVSQTSLEDIFMKMVEREEATSTHQ
ncbi:ABC transporter A family protein [Heterostelium album PN500]|uniref:ABC transporter A family protein n=1 Tax=Heterostelium pallidum (strain ATCC 26659 / Pp 5 / PN500) TaxID=670386 RepID=D3BDQ3_HETP5|nr:ABC transporter A family protein [Heterostelium album PN500]EFA80034.1 ABC transporter A family protein [Heterostelium album PN500]|eukprot:XP_020432154.1 ABC transporter A family protein [Heterostelium album PN500]